MSHLSDSELDRRLAEGRPVLPAGFTDRVMRRAAEGGPSRHRPSSGPVEVPAIPRRWFRLALVSAVVAAAAAMTLVVSTRTQDVVDRGWHGATGTTMPANLEIAVPLDGHLRLERGAGVALELAGGSRGRIATDSFNLQHGRVRLEGAVAVTTPRARVVGIARDTLAELSVEDDAPNDPTDRDTKETDMTLKTMTALTAAAAGSVLTVAVIRGNVQIRPDGPNPAVAATLTVAAGERAVIPRPDDAPAPVASTTNALMSRPAAAAPEAASGDECPPMAAQPNCEDGADCANCDETPEPAGSDERVHVNADGPSLGPVTARVTIVEFADYQCPFCEKAMSSIHSLAAMYPKDVRVVLRNFPMPGHKNARQAAEAALAAGEQGKYWEMHDLLLANQERLDRASIESYAANLGLDAGRFRRALDDGRFAAQIDRDIQDAKDLGLQGVPAFVINGRIVVGSRPLEDMKKLVDEELAQ